MKESDLFPYIKEYFLYHEPQSEIFTEVAECGGPRPDIVIRCRGIITVVELKTTLSMKVIEQAFNWRYKANYVYIAVPKTKTQINKFVLQILNDYGIGLLKIDVMDENSIEYYKNCLGNDFTLATHVDLEYYSKPKLFRNKCSYLNWNKSLKDIYRYENNVNGGNRGGGYNTEYKAMVSDIRWYFRRKNNEWALLKEIIEGVSSISRHYSNAKAGLYNALTTIEFEEFESKIEGKNVYFRLKIADKV